MQGQVWQAGTTMLQQNRKEQAEHAGITRNRRNTQDQVRKVGTG